MNNRLALGTVQFGLDYGVANKEGKVLPEHVCEIIAAAAKAGIHTLDTAIAYGNSESVLGSCGVAGWEIVTKLPAFPSGDEDLGCWALNQTEASLIRLNVDSTHGILLHRPEQLLSNQGCRILRALELVKAKGYTKKIGVSVYAPQDLSDVIDLGVIDLVQAPLNILDRRLVESGWSQKLSESGIELHVRSVFLQGLLLMDDMSRPTKFNRWSMIWDEWKLWLEESDQTALEACMRYVLSVPGVARVIVGVDSLEHLESILSAAKGDLFDLPIWPIVPDEELINPVFWTQL